MQLVQLDMKQISSEAEIYDCLVGQMNFTNADEKPEWMNVIEMNERDPYEMDTEEQPEDPEERDLRYGKIVPFQKFRLCLFFSSWILL